MLNQFSRTEILLGPEAMKRLAESRVVGESRQRRGRLILAADVHQKTVFTVSDNVYRTFASRGNTGKTHGHTLQQRVGKPLVIA